MQHELGSIVQEYRRELDADFDIEDRELKVKLSEAYDSIIEQSKRVTGLLNMRAVSFEAYRHPTNPLIQVWPQGKAQITTRLRADGLVTDDTINTALNHLFFHPHMDEFEHPPMSGSFYHRL